LPRELFTWVYPLQTAELKDAVYECGWLSMPNIKFRKSLCIIMSHLQVPLTICVGKFFFLSVNTFFTIIKSSYSFYIVLKQVNAQKE
ncbi:odorant receptor 43a-like, partial [Leptopilina boulardi]|uniref:odorant receptor 43a-like n=1 Tax=Leptopilina boulardi TaxID=63433 RepID=UPI0021F56E17